MDFRKTKIKTVPHLFNHVTALVFIILEVLIHIHGQDWHLAQVVKVHPGG